MLRLRLWNQDVNREQSTYLNRKGKSDVKKRETVVCNYSEFSCNDLREEVNLMIG